MNTVKLSDKHLETIRDALETYFRMKTGQISIALDIVYNHKLNHYQTDSIESIVKTLALPEIANRGVSYSFNSEEIKDGKIAYEISKVIDEYLSVKNNDGYYGYGVNFHGPLKASNEPLPQILDHKNYKDFNLDKKNSKKVNKFFAAKDFDGMWKFLDSLNLNLPSGEKTEIIPSFNNVTIRVTKPRKDTP